MTGRRAPRAELAPSRLTVPWLTRQLRHLCGPLRGQRLCLAFSGGLDSTVLLFALARLARREGFALRALHVNHQWQPAADAWARSAVKRARDWGVACRVLRVRVELARGQSPEAAARSARYQALADALKPGERLLTAHHQRDQFETVLLALMRGRGVRALSGMAGRLRWRGTWLLRPLLPVAHAQLQQFAQRHALVWSEDPSNADTRFDRNFVRAEIAPRLRQRWPAADAVAARSAALLAEADQLLQLQAREGLRAARDGAALRASALRRWPAAQRRQVLRLWLAERGLPLPDQPQLEEVAGALLAARVDALPCVRWPGAQLHRHGDRLLAFEDTPLAAPLPQRRWLWRAQPWLALGAGDALGLLPDRHGDVRLTALPAQLRVEYRQGGERLREADLHRPLKDLLQQQALAPWLRERVPLLRHGRRIIAVGDLWLDPRYRADAADAAAERGRLRWRRHDRAHDIGI